MMTIFIVNDLVNPFGPYPNYLILRSLFNCACCYCQMLENKEIYSVYRLSKLWLSDSNLFFYRMLTLKGWSLVNAFAVITNIPFVRNIFFTFISTFYLLLICEINSRVISFHLSFLIKWFSKLEKIDRYCCSRNCKNELRLYYIIMANVLSKTNKKKKLTR